MRYRHRRSLQRSLTDSEAAGSAPHPSAPHALGPEHARREHRSLPSRPMYMHAAVPSFWEVAMLSVPVFDSWEGPKRQSAIGDAILGKKFFPAYAHTLPVRPLGEGGSENFFFGNRLDTAPRWSTVSLEAQACRIEAVSARVRR